MSFINRKSPYSQFAQFCNFRRLMPNISAEPRRSSCSGNGRLYGSGHAPNEGERKVRQPDQARARDYGGSLQDVYAAPDITGPVISLRDIQQFGLDSRKAA